MATYLIKWRNPEALGSIDVIDTDLFHGNRPKEHPALIGQHVVMAAFDLQRDGHAIIFSYGGRHGAANAAQEIFLGDLRFDPATFATATSLQWRDQRARQWEDVPVQVELVPSMEGARQEGHATYVVRSSWLAFFKRAEASARGRLRCEACGFTGHRAYGDANEKCFEVHHKQPIAQGERVTKLSDLVLVCANCHNAIHGLNDVSFEVFLSRFEQA